jgi:phage baseplate assembly protein V
MTDAFTAADQANRLNNAVRFGVVSAVQLGGDLGALVRVEIEDGLVTDFLPVFQASAGRVGAWSAPVVGEQVAVFAPSGELTAGAVLRGLPSNAFPTPTSDDDRVVLSDIDGFSDVYDVAEMHRTIAVPAGGKLTLSVGALQIRIESGRIVMEAAGSPIEMTASAFTLNGPVSLGGSGGQRVARIGDTVSGGVITGGSTTVRAV